MSAEDIARVNFSADWGELAHLSRKMHKKQKSEDRQVRFAKSGSVHTTTSGGGATLRNGTMRGGMKNFLEKCFPGGLHSGSDDDADRLTGSSPSLESESDEYEDASTPGVGDAVALINHLKSGRRGGALGTITRAWADESGSVRVKWDSDSKSSKLNASMVRRAPQSATPQALVHVLRAYEDHPHGGAGLKRRLFAAFLNDYGVGQLDADLVFNEIDYNHDGRIQPCELEQALKGVMQLGDSAEDGIAKLVKRCTRHASGFMSPKAKHHRSASDPIPDLSALRDASPAKRSSQRKRSLKSTPEAVTWRVKEVTTWLKKIGMVEHTYIFKRRSVDGHKLLQMTSAGISGKLGIRTADAKKIMKEIQKMKKRKSAPPRPALARADSLPNLDTTHDRPPPRPKMRMTQSNRR